MFNREPSTATEGEARGVSLLTPCCYFPLSASDRSPDTRRSLYMYASLVAVCSNPQLTHKAERPSEYGFLALLLYYNIKSEIKIVSEYLFEKRNSGGHNLRGNLIFFTQ